MKTTYAEVMFTFLVMDWLGTLGAGMLGRWNEITAPLLFTIVIFITILNIVSIFKKEIMHIGLGIASLYMSYSFILAAYKIAYGNFDLEAKWLFIAFAVNALLTALLVYIVKKSKKRKKKSKKGTIFAISAATILAVVYPVTRCVKMLPSEAVPILLICALLLFAIFGNCGIFFILNGKITGELEE